MMRCGVAAGDFTPLPGAVLQGHWSTNPSHSVLYPLEARAAVFEQDGVRTAIVTLDVIGVTRETTQRIRERAEAACGIAPAHVMVACSHTHCSPATLPCLGMETDADYLSRIVDEAAGCIERASADLRPVTLGIGCGSVHFNISRRPLPGSSSMALNYGGIVDRRARVLRVEAQDGSPLAVLFHYACHATTKSGSDGYISPDYPGVARRVIEETLGCKALFTAGCFGNVRPAVLGEDGRFTSATKEQLDARGGELGREVCRVAKSLRTRPYEALMSRRTEMEMPFGDPLPESELQKMADDTSDRGRLLTGPWARRVLEMVRSNRVPTGKPTEMQLMTIGPLALVSIPGEPVQEIGHAIEKRLRPLLAAEDVWPVGYGNDEIGYLCTERHHQEGGYEPMAFPYYGEPAPYRDEEQTVLTAAERLATE